MQSVAGVHVLCRGGDADEVGHGHHEVGEGQVEQQEPGHRAVLSEEHEGRHDGERADDREHAGNSNRHIASYEERFVLNWKGHL